MVQRRQPAARGRVARSLRIESGAVAAAHGMARFAPFADGFRDDLDGFQRSLTELDVTGGLALDPLTFGLQIGFRLLQLADQPVQLLDRRRRDLLDERGKLVAAEAGSASSAGIEKDGISAATRSRMPSATSLITATACTDRSDSMAFMS